MEEGKKGGREKGPHEPSEVLPNRWHDPQVARLASNCTVVHIAFHTVFDELPVQEK